MISAIEFMAGVVALLFLILVCVILGTLLAAMLMRGPFDD